MTKSSLTFHQKPLMDLFLPPMEMNSNVVDDRFFHFGDGFISNCLRRENNTFWQNVLNSWLGVMKGLKLIRNMKIPVWYNSDITVNNR